MPTVLKSGRVYYLNWRDSLFCRGRVALLIILKNIGTPLSSVKMQFLFKNLNQKSQCCFNNLNNFKTSIMQKKIAPEKSLMFPSQCVTINKTIKTLLTFQIKISLTACALFDIFILYHFQERCHYF